MSESIKNGEMQTKTLTCIVCPRGCTLTVKLDPTAAEPVQSVEGQGCPRGRAYAITECTAPVRVLTTTAPLAGGGVVPCKTDRPIPRELLMEAMALVNGLAVSGDVEIGDVLAEDILGTGARIVATARKKRMAGQ